MSPHLNDHSPHVANGDRPRHRYQIRTYFSSWAAPFKIISNVCKAEKNCSILMFIEMKCVKFLSKFVLIDFYGLLFQVTKRSKGTYDRTG